MALMPLWPDIHDKIQGQTGSNFLLVFANVQYH